MRGRRRRLEIGYQSAGARAAYLRVAQLVAEATGVAFADIVRRYGPGRGRLPRLRFAREATIYLTVVACDVPQGRLARALERPRVRILSACRRAEDARDLPKIDALFERLEAML